MDTEKPNETKRDTRSRRERTADRRMLGQTQLCHKSLATATAFGTWYENFLCIQYFNALTNVFNTNDQRAHDLKMI